MNINVNLMKVLNLSHLKFKNSALEALVNVLSSSGGKELVVSLIYIIYNKIDVVKNKRISNVHTVTS